MKQNWSPPHQEICHHREFFRWGAVWEVVRGSYPTEVVMWQLPMRAQIKQSKFETLKKINLVNKRKFIYNQSKSFLLQTRTNLYDWTHSTQSRPPPSPCTPACPGWSAGLFSPPSPPLPFRSVHRLEFQYCQVPCDGMRHRCRVSFPPTELYIFLSRCGCIVTVASTSQICAKKFNCDYIAIIPNLSPSDMNINPCRCV